MTHIAIFGAVAFICAIAIILQLLSFSREHKIFAATIPISLVAVLLVVFMQFGVKVPNVDGFIAQYTMTLPVQESE